MSRINRRTLLAGSLAALGTPPFAATLHGEEPTRMSLVLTNDLYKISEEKGRGGIARLAAILRKERLSGNTTVFTHAGDALSPSLLSGFDKGEAMLDLLNMLRPDIFVPGNHEFDFGKDMFLQRMSGARFPLVAANLRMPSGGEVPGFVDMIMLDVAGIHIGISGATLDDTPAVSSPNDLKFSETVDTLTRTAKSLRKQGADLTIAVVHATKNTIAALVATRLYDIIISGHNHDLAINYDGRTLTAESEEDARHVLVLDLEMRLKITGENRALNWWPNIRIIDSASVIPDADTLEKVKSYESKMSTELDVEIATLGVDLDTREASVRTRETAFGNLVADALRHAAGADIALTNGGGIRGDKTYATGSKLARRDILSELPFGNRTVIANISGKTLLAALEHGVSQGEKAAGRFPQISGFKVIVNRAALAGQRIQSVEINGQPLDETRIYKLATNDFLLKGGDGYTMLAAGAGPDAGDRLMANDVIDEVTKLGTVQSAVEGRLTFR